jgi:DNA adenine methylase
MDRRECPTSMQAQQLLSFDLTDAKPFLKWAGGKSRLLKRIEPFLPPADLCARYHEPFLGGGAMFFHLRPETAFLSDRLQDVVIAFRVVRDNVDELIAKLENHQKRHAADAKAHYAAVRKQDPRNLSSVDKAARVIYLNKTCYNGIYRVNSAREFNVPMGVYKNPRIVDSETLYADSAALKNASLKHLDYSSALGKVSKGDFVYLDPPYWRQFTGYHQNGFGMEQQRNLARLFRSLHETGVHLMLSNGPDEDISGLYDGFRKIELDSTVVLSGSLKGRRKVKELLVINYDPDTGELLKS